MKSFLITLILATGLFSAQLATAQKFGHINSALIIEKHPDVDSANIHLESFRKSLSDPFEVKARAFQSKYQFYLEEMQAGTLSKVSAQSRQEALQKEQDELKTEEQQIQFAIMQKREQLLQPMLAEVDSVIQAVGKEGKYTLIFDSSVAGALLYAIESEDLTALIQSRIK